MQRPDLHPPYCTKISSPIKGAAAWLATPHTPAKTSDFSSYWARHVETVSFLLIPRFRDEKSLKICVLFCLPQLNED